MNRFARVRAIVTSAVLAMCTTTTAHAMPIVFVGQDGQNVTTNSEAAFSAWKGSVANNFVLDNLDGILGSDDSSTFRSTDLGNTFTTAPGDDLLGGFALSTNVLQGTFLRVTQGSQDNVSSFTWTLARQADAFGFFARDNDGGVVTIGFNDGSSQQFAVNSLGPNDNMFWGISGLAGTVSSVQIASTDPDQFGSQNSAWDRFVVRTVNVTEPPAVALALLGAVVLVVSRLRGA